MISVRQIVEEESARDFMRRHSRPKIETVSLRFLRRLLVQTPVSRIEIARSNIPPVQGQPHCDGVLRITTNYYHQDRNKTYQVEFCSYSVLAQALRQWRNLSGVDLFVDGKPAGKISYANPVLKELAD